MNAKIYVTRNDVVIMANTTSRIVIDWRILQLYIVLYLKTQNRIMCVWTIANYLLKDR
jgi:hypothetical protein